MPCTGNVISINRGADFWRRRALKSRQSLRYPDTVRLLRHAVHTEPDNLRCHMDLADAYAEMHCYEQSNRALLDILARRIDDADAYYMLADNYIHMGLYDRAMDAMSNYVRYAPDHAYSDDVRDTIEWLQSDVTEHVVKARCRRMTERAIRLIDSDQKQDQARGRAMITHALRVSRCGDCALAMSAMLSAHGHFSEAMRCCRHASGELGESDLALLLHEAMASGGAGNHNLAERLLLQAGKALETTRDIEYFCQAAQSVRADAAVVIVMKALLATRPYATAIKHKLAIALYNMGEKDAARAHWRAINALDSSDRIAEYWMTPHASDPARLPYFLGLPMDMLWARLDRFFSETDADSIHLSDRQLDELKWMFHIPIEHVQLQLLIMVRRQGRELGIPITREILTMDTLTGIARQFAVIMLEHWGEPPPYLSVVNERLTQIAISTGRTVPPGQDWRYFFRLLCVCLQPDVPPREVSRRAYPIWRLMRQDERERAAGADVDAWLGAFQKIVFQGAGLHPPKLPKRRLNRASRSLKLIMRSRKP